MKAVYPGSFDPITFGHIDIVERASKLFEKVYILIANNTSKNSLFTVDERIDMIKIATKSLNNVEILSFDGLVADFMKTLNAKIIIRGLRAVSDYEYELMLANFNKNLNKNIETLFLTTNVKYSYLNSTTVKEIAKLGGKVTDFVPKIVEQYLKTKFHGSA